MNNSININKHHSINSIASVARGPCRKVHYLCLFLTVRVSLSNDADFSRAKHVDYTVQRSRRVKVAVQFAATSFIIFSVAEETRPPETSAY